MKYFGSWGSVDDMKKDFFPPSYDYAARKYRQPPAPEDFPADDEILFASYGGRSYEGDAQVVFERGGKLFAK